MSGSAWRRDVDKLAEQFGCTVAPSSGGHLRLAHPSGWVQFTSSTPGDRRTLDNLRSYLRRKAAGIGR